MRYLTGIPMFDIDELDPECRALVLVMNAFPGIHTSESCCGHGVDPFMVWFSAESLDALSLLVYHTNFFGWHVVVEPYSAMPPITFKLEGPVGAFADVETMVADMQEYLLTAARGFVYGCQES